MSKIGDFASYGSDPRRIEYAGANTDGLSVDYKAKYAAQQQVIKDNYKFFDVPMTNRMFGNTLRMGMVIIAKW